MQMDCHSIYCQKKFSILQQDSKLDKVSLLYSAVTCLRGFKSTLTLRRLVAHVYALKAEFMLLSD